MIDRARAWLARRAGIDRRALAATRILLGVVLFVDIVLRARFLRAFYTDAGLLPRATLRGVRPGFAAVSLHALSGDLWLQATLFGLAAVLALAVAVGYRTRLAVIGSFLLLVSLHARNPIVLNAGDSLLRRLLLWGVFLPLGTRWSVDAVVSETSHGGRDTGRIGRHVASVASVGLLVQVVVVYATNAVVKLRGERWPDGTAMQYVFELDRFTILAGDALAGHATLLSVLGWLWLAALVASPALLFCTGRRRTALAGVLLGGHLGMAVTLWIGLFPVISIAGLVPFLGSGVWDRVERLVQPAGRRLAGRLGRARRPIRDGGSDETDRPSRVLSRLGLERDTLRVRVPRDRVRRGTAVAGRVLAATLLVGLLVWNAAALGVGGSDGENVAGTSLDPEQYRWDMFAPGPPREAAWVTAPATTTDGDRVDAYARGTLDRSRPAELADTYPSTRWRKYLVSVWWSGDDRLANATADYLCARWDRTHDTRLERVTLVVTTEPTRFGKREPLDRQELVTRECRT